MVRSAGGNKFVEFDDGVLGFATDMSSLSGIGLILDADASAARRQGHFFDLATARGNQLVMSEGAYADSLEAAFSKQNSFHGNDGLYGIHSSELIEYTLQPVALDRKTDERLYRLIRKRDIKHKA
jgi:hypothetical protein